MRIRDMFTIKRDTPIERKDGFSSVIYDNISSDTTGRFQRNNAGYAAMYAANPYLFRAIGYIAQNCAGIEWDVFSDSAKTKEFDDHPALTLLNNPNPDTRRSLFIEQLVSYRLLTGNSYMAVAGPNNGPPTQLWSLRPDRIIVQVPNGEVTGYQYNIGRESQTFDVSKVLHWKSFNPYDDYYGLSPVMVAATVVDSMASGEEWNLSLKQNSGRPSGAIIASTPLSPDAYATLKREITRSYSGAKHAGKPLLLQGGLDWKQFSLSPMDVDWLNDKKQSAREIALTLGVPPELLGDSANKTYSNYGEARKSFLEETVLPLMDSLREELNSFLGPLFNVYFDYDKDDIEALQEDRDRVVARITGLWDKGLLFFNEARVELGYEVHTEDFANTQNCKFTTIKDMGVAPVAPSPINEDKPSSDGSDKPADTNPTPSDGNVEPVVDENSAANEGASWVPPLDFKALDLKEENYGLYWKAIEDRRGYWYDKAQKSVNDYFKMERKAVLSAIPDGKAAIKKALDSKRKEMVKTIGNIYLVVGRDFAKGVYNSIKMQAPLEVKDDSQDDTPVDDGSGDSVDMWAQYVQDYLTTQAGTKIVQISDVTMQLITDRLAEGAAEGESIPQLADRIKGLYDEFYKNRSRTIARTEVIGASNGGAMVGAKQTGLTLDKEWISTLDSRTREWHAKADIQTVPQDDSFIVNGEELGYPGDATAGASGNNLINCRCTVAFKRAQVAKATNFTELRADVQATVARMRKNLDKRGLDG